MGKWLRSLFAKPLTQHNGPQLQNHIQVNEVLKRYRPPSGPGPTPPARQRAAEPVLTARGHRDGNADAPEATAPEFDFGDADLSLEDTPGEDGINPYNTGRFTAAELWEKRHRRGLI